MEMPIVRPVAGALLFSEQLHAVSIGMPAGGGGGGGKRGRSDGGPTPKQRVAAAKKQVSEIESTIKAAKERSILLESALPTLTDPVLIIQYQTEIQSLLQQLTTLDERKLRAEAELEAAQLAEADAEIADAERKAELKAAREMKQLQNSADAEAKAEKRRQKFFEEFPKGADDGDYLRFQEERRKIDLEKDTWKALGNSNETWRLWKGNQYAVEDKLRRTLKDREEAFDDWPFLRKTLEFQIRVWGELRKVLEAQAKRIRKAPVEIQEAIGKLLAGSDLQKQTQLDKKTGELAVAQLDVANVLPLVLSEIARNDALLETIQNKKAEETALQTFLEEYNVQGALPGDWETYRDEKERQEQQKKDFLDTPGNTEELWLLRFGNRYKAEDNFRKSLNNREDAFDNWEDSKLGSAGDIQKAERTFLLLQIKKVKNRVSQAQKRFDDEYAKGDAAMQPLLASYTSAIQVQAAAASAILPVLEAKLAEFDAVIAQAKEALKDAKREESEAMKAARLEEKARLKREKEEVEELEKQQRAAEREARKQERLAEEAALKAEKEAERAANNAEKERLKEEAAAARRAAAEAKKEANRAAAEAKKAKEEAKEQERKQLYEAKLDEIKKEVEDAPSRLAAATLVLDSERKRLQALFDAMPDPGASEEEAKWEPTEKREVGRGNWPVCQIPLSHEQHMNLFLTEKEIFAEDDDSSSATGAASTSGDITMVPEQGGSETMDVGVSAKMLQQLRLQDDLGAPLSEVALYSADPLMFNKPYARRLLTAHIESLKTINEAAMAKNEKAKYVAVWSALGTDIPSAVEDLLPQWEQMLRYRNTMLKAKEIQLEQDKVLTEALDGRATDTERQLEAIKQHKVKEQWEIEARRMVEADRGQLPGQLYTPQPHFLPLRISAPPRVGKSATALLMATLAKRAGMKTVYSVSPNKNTPIQEMQTKLIRIGWRDLDEAQEVDRLVREKHPGYYKNAECLQMKYSHFVVDNVPGQSKAAPNYKKIDMILYSSDVPDDCQRIGAILANWRYRDVIVFHIRDEAQSLAKALVNSVVSAHKRDVPPPVELQYLRYYYGNNYGFNCNVTATHFPTLLEENMWGYIGSVQQNSRAGLPLSAGTRKISVQVGSNFLPILVPALLPVVSPGYIGVRAIRTWAPGGVARFLQMGANHSGVDFNTGELRRVVESLPADTKNKKKAAAAVPRMTRAERAEARRKAIEGGLDDEEKEDARQTAIRDARKSVEEILKGGDPDYVAGLEDEVSEEEQEEEEYIPTKKRGLTQAQKKAKKEAEKAERERKAALDIKSITEHYEEWLSAAEAQENDINYWNAPSGEGGGGSGDEEMVEKGKGEGGEEDMDEEGEDEDEDEKDRPVNLVPMYIGALNNEVSDTGMASFVRAFGASAHKYAVDKKGTVGSKDENTIAQRRKKHGVAFVLFTTALETRQDVLDSSIKLQDTPNDGDQYEENAQGPVLRKLPVPPPESAGAPPPCEPVAESKKMSALCCVYDPQDPKNKKLASGKEPFFTAFFVSAADVAIEEVWKTLNINKICILGYGMLKAGLTVQTVMDQRTDDEEKKPVGPLRIYCPKYVALATAENAALDAQLQIAGRSFVELKNLTAPTGWSIEYLGVEGRVEALQRYSDMEERLARISGKRVYEALKEGFGTRMMITNSLGTLGVVGTQRGDFGSILGLTPTDARRRANAARKVRESVAPGGTLSENDQKALLEQAEEAAKAEAAAKADLARAAAVPADDTDGMDVEN